jgi:Protein of unknown function (DUF2490)
MIKKTIVLLLLILANISVFGQAKLGSWNILNINLKVNSKWNVFAESQIRSLSFYDEFHYYEIKTGATFKIDKQFSATSGFGSYNTYSEGGDFKNPIQNKEIRTWAQINMKQKTGIVNFEHRYRAEQRFTNNGFKNRFRYRLGATIPINSNEIKEKTLYLNVWNEIFFTNKEPFFERNRLLVGFGYEFNKNLAFQTGYIHQFDYKINDEIGRDFLNIAILYNFNLHKEPTDYIPSTND